MEEKERNSQINYWFLPMQLPKEKCLPVFEIDYLWARNLASHLFLYKDGLLEFCFLSFPVDDLLSQINISTCAPFTSFSIFYVSNISFSISK